MALSLLDGTSAAFDFTTSALSWKCKANYCSADINRDMLERTTFCSGAGWRERIPALKQVLGRLEGFIGKGGNAADDPMYLFSSNNAPAFVMTFDTGCTLSGSMHATRLHLGIRAAQNSELALDWESTGAVTSAWVTS